MTRLTARDVARAQLSMSGALTTASTLRFHCLIQDWITRVAESWYDVDGLMASRADLIACAVLDQFETLPPKRKPAKRGHDLHEWVPLSGIVAESEGKLTCIALA